MKRLGFAILAAVAVCSFVVLAEFVLTPIYERGVCPRLLPSLLSLSHLLKVPAMLVPLPQGPVWMVGVLAAVSFAAAWLLHAVWWPLRTPRPLSHSGEGAAPSRPRLTRRGFIVGAARVACAGAAGSLGYAFFVEPRRFEIVRREIKIDGLPAELAGLRLVQLTDLHLGPFIPLSHIQRAIDISNRLSPDLILLTGDYVSSSPAYIDPVASALGRLRARIGVLGVLGNHDWWEGGAHSTAALQRSGVRMIDNTRCILTPDRRLVERADLGLCFAGLGDLLEGRPDCSAALGDLPTAMPRIVLAHNPDMAEEPSLVYGGYRVDLMICGHTHGGQVYVPGQGTPVVPSQYGQKYASGLVHGPVCRVYISRGVGMAVLPLRCGVRPEITLIELA